MPTHKKHKPIATQIEFVDKPELREIRLPRVSLARKIDIEKLAVASADAFHAAIEADDLDVAYSSICDTIVASVPPRAKSKRRAQLWFDTECYCFKRFLLQAFVLATLHVFMRPWYSDLRVQYKKLLYAKQKAFRLVEELV